MVRAEIEGVAVGVGEVRDHPIGLDAGVGDESGSERDETVELVVELGRGTGEIEVGATSSVGTALESDPPSARRIAEHDPPVAVLALDLVESEGGGPERGERIGVGGIDRDEVESGGHESNHTRGHYALAMAEFRVVFIARDYDETVGFFTDVMGLQILRSFEEGGKGTILLAADGQIEVFDPSVGWGEPGVRGARMAWEVDDAAAEYARIVAAGGEVESEPELKPWGHKSFVVQGPDGWSITLFEIVVPQ